MYMVMFWSLDIANILNGEFQYLFLIVIDHYIMSVIIFTASIGEYKASLYTLMTYSQQGDLKSAEPVARYLFYRSHLLDRHMEVRCVSCGSFYALRRQ